MDCPMCAAGDSPVFDRDCPGCEIRHIARSPRGDAGKMIMAYRQKHGDVAADDLKAKVRAEFEMNKGGK